jgi:ubiquinone/menaquinone biosynthesis C-methylase UbiE
MSALQFTDQAARRLEALYLTADVVGQRAETLRQLHLAEGDSVLDIGCGPGFLCESMADIVGPSGRVVGIDISADLVTLAGRRNSRQWLSYRVGEATAIDEPDATFNVATCTQVAEYIPEVDKALSEAFRILKPGGRAVFVATDWDGVVWHSDAPDRMATVLRSWEAHCAHPRLPCSMAERLRAGRFVIDRVTIFPILNLEWDDTTYSKGLSEFVVDFVGRRGDIDKEELSAWADELAQLGKEGRYFFSSSRFIFHASKPRVK